MAVNFPNSQSLEMSVLRALTSHGGTATTAQIDSFVMTDLKLSNEQINQLRSGNRTELQYRLAWVRTKAKKKGLIERTVNRTWKLTQS